MAPTRRTQLREINVHGFNKRLSGMLDVYTAAMDPPADQLTGRYAIMQRHTGNPGFRAIVAEQHRLLPRGDDLAAFIYGFHGAEGQWWHDVVHGALTEQGGTAHADEWLGDTFEVAELHVRPAFQGQGLGRRLLTGLCAGRPETTMVLSTLDRPRSRARSLYRSAGLIDLLTGFQFPGGGPRYAVMGARLPLPAYESAPSSP